MQYRKFGRLDWQGSALGFGAMRLPTLEARPLGVSTHEMANVDELVAIDMIRAAIDAGVNYVDTARPYHQGQSEIVVGKALRDGYRSKIKLATKLSSGWVKKEEDFDTNLDAQLERLQTDHIDMYLLHGLQDKRWRELQALGVFEWAERAIADGRIGHLGFSFHDELPLFREIVDAYDWTSCQILYNYMDIEFQAGMEGLKYAANKGLAITIMEPLRGGQLARTPPQSVAEIWNEAEIQRTPADWALQWLWNQPEVSLVLSGMSTPDQVAQNVASAERSGVGSLSSRELGLVDRAREAFRSLSPIPCTDCKYCQPCPQGVDIPRVFATYNQKVMYGEQGAGITAFSDYGRSAKQSKQCIACGQCEAVCPQLIGIIEWLKTVAAYLTAPNA
ncbi:aldo/keto reductase [Candidatus Bipolaricaulota bacterium]|nr:aldo/keto reductase [Candidatus Bipolaricaulota bacterium]